jgi:hypothetical protein
MLMIQIAIGVFLGLWLFRYVVTRPPRAPRDWVKTGIAVIPIVIAVLWWLDMLLLSVGHP